VQQVSVNRNGKPPAKEAFDECLHEAPGKLYPMDNDGHTLPTCASLGCTNKDAHSPAAKKFVGRHPAMLVGCLHRAANHSQFIPGFLHYSFHQCVTGASMRSTETPGQVDDSQCANYTPGYVPMHVNHS
jgi:hypothetical protein